MKLIKENLFLVILVAAVVVIGGVMLYLDFSVDDDVVAEAKARTDLSSRLKGFTAPGNLVNDRVVAAEANRVNVIIEEANKVVQDQRRRNQLRYTVLQLPVIDAGMTKRIQAAFPFDAKLYLDYGLTMQFIEVHRGATFNCLHALSPTRIPTDQEIAQEKAILRSETEGVLAAPAGPAAPAGLDATALDRKAIERAVFNKALGGRVYVDDESTAADITFTAAQNAENEAVLWIKQVKLWVLQDVVAALAAANDQVLSKLPSETDRCVINSPVKRLVWVKVSNGYAVKGADASAQMGGGAGGPGGGYGGGPGGGVGSDRGTAPPPDPAYGGGMPAQPAYVPAAPAAPAAPGGPAGESFTQRFSTQDIDVMPYTFQVVMPTRYIPMVIEKVCRGRMHTIVAVKCEEVLRDPRYFYSNDPVMLVTFSGEAIFFASWERDLAPASFLRTLMAVAPSAMREIDKQRLSK